MSAHGQSNPGGPEPFAGLDAVVDPPDVEAAGAASPSDVLPPWASPYVAAGAKGREAFDRWSAHSGGGSAVFERVVDVTVPVGALVIARALDVPWKQALIAAAIVGVVGNVRPNGSAPVGRSPLTPSVSPLVNATRVITLGGGGVAAATKMVPLVRSFSGA